MAITYFTCLSFIRQNLYLPDLYVPQSHPVLSEQLVLHLVLWTQNLFTNQNVSIQEKEVE